ncbi:MAG TPA: SusC/RagA family protein [Dysgonomonas sp.]|nr:SusC/RagA family protein [Dysgonomonas sp.]
MKNFFLLLFALCLSIQINAQTKQITGLVVDTNGEPIVGAAVSEENTTNGTFTDIDGRFSLGLSGNNKLIIKFMGYKTQSINVGNRSHLDLVLEEDSKVLDEIVVTGYSGTQLRSKVTSSISKVDNETFEVGLFSNPAQALSGAVAGLRVTQASGDPGATPTIILRGGTNLNGTGSPLVVVDGQIRPSMSDINPEDIESMDVLKDAGATAIYGARASNGVVLITTKTGKSGKAQINFKAKVGLNYLNSPYKFVGARDYLYWQRLAVQGANELGYGPNDLTAQRPYGTGNTYGKSPWSTMYLDSENEWLLGKGWETMIDPLDPEKTLIFKNTDPTKTNFNNPAISQDYNVNMSGGNDKGSYYAGLGYNHSEGVPIKSFYKRYNFTFNGDYKITRWLKSESRFNFTKAEWQKLPGSQGSEAHYFGRILSVPPTVRYYDEDGNALLGPSSADGNQNYQPDKWQVDNESEKFSMTQALQIDFMKGLYLRASMNWYYSDQYLESFTKDYESPQGVFQRKRESKAEFHRTYDQTYNAVLNFNRRIAEDHNVTALVGTEFYNTYTRFIKASGSGAPTDDFGDLGLTDPGANMRSIDTEHQRRKIFSYFGNISYDYKDRYLLNAVFRKDGYSTIHKNNRWGFFPGVSAGWIFSRESFMEQLNDRIKLSYGKVRLSYGVNGNASGISTYQVQGSYETVKYDGQTGYLVGKLPLPNLKWEKTKTFEVGLETHFLDHRLRGSFTYYNRLTSDKHSNVSFPTSTGFSSSLTNNGNLQNRGVEMEFGADIIQTKDWNWNASLNFAYNKNEVKKLPFNGLERNRQDAVEIYTGKLLPDGKYEKIWVGGYQEGYETQQLVLYQADGIYKSYDEIPGNLVVQTNGTNAQKLYGPDAWAALPESEKAKKSNLPIQPGDVKWFDVNGDDIIDQYDKVLVGNRIPRWTGGFNTQLSWKGLTLHARFDFAMDYWIYQSNAGSKLPWFLGNMQGTYNMTTDVFDTWTEDNPDAKYPRFLWADQNGKANYNMPSTMFAQKGNYLAFREVSLSYQLPKSIANKLEMQAVSVSVTGQNLGYWTSKKNTVASPEVTDAGAGYALPRTLIFGLNVTF